MGALPGIDVAHPVILITGANTGIGRITALHLADLGACMVLAGRDPARTAPVVQDIIQRTGRADAARYLPLDLGDLHAVRQAAEQFLSWGMPLHALINNAGVAGAKGQTRQGFELAFGTNHLGHFALTGLLLPALVARPRSRVVTVSSGAHRMGRMDFEDLMGAQRYGKWKAYGQSKLANLLFTAELQRRLDRSGSSVKAMAAHPGFAATDLVFDRYPVKRSIGERVMGWGTGTLAQSAQMGALPTLYAATAPGLAGDSYVGPDGWMEQRGHPKVVDRAPGAKERAAAERLWSVSEELTGVRYPFD